MYKIKRILTIILVLGIIYIGYQFYNSFFDNQKSQTLQDSIQKVLTNTLGESVEKSIEDSFSQKIPSNQNSDKITNNDWLDKVKVSATVTKLVDGAKSLVNIGAKESGNASDYLQKPDNNGEVSGNSSNFGAVDNVNGDNTDVDAAQIDLDTNQREQIEKALKKPEDLSTAGLMMLIYLYGHRNGVNINDLIADPAQFLESIKSSFNDSEITIFKNAIKDFLSREDAWEVMSEKYDLDQSLKDKFDLAKSLIPYLFN